MSRRNHRRFTAHPAYVYQLVRKDSSSDRLKFNSQRQKAVAEGRFLIAPEAVRALLHRQEGARP